MDAVDVRVSTFLVKSGFGNAKTGIRVEHVPTGLVAESSRERSEHMNKAIAFSKLEAMVKTKSGGVKADKVTVSDKARAVAALQKEFELLEAKQLEVGEQMAVLVAQQVVLSEKCRLIKQSMMELLK